MAAADFLLHGDMIGLAPRSRPALRLTEAKVAGGALADAAFAATPAGTVSSRPAVGVVKK